MAFLEDAAQINTISYFSRLFEKQPGLFFNKLVMELTYSRCKTIV